MSLSPQWLDELRSRITLSGVIGRTTRVTKAGREFKACCPFHNEKTPSFTINDEKGFYHCFGCGAHGDVIRWMTDQRGMAFMDAVKSLAEEAGMEVPAPDPQIARAQARQAEAQAGLHEAMAAAQAWFVARLASDEGARARAYLATRGFDARTVREFGFGYAPEGRQALKAALAPLPEALLIEAGLRIAIDGEDGPRREPYDRFRGRLMLPIADARGRTIAFGGRILDAEKKDAPKYLNSPETPLFDKGRTLYNLHRAGPAARQAGRVIVVEGYMDVVAMAAAGIGECVAPLGTALTEPQIALLWRIEPMPLLCFDGDAAGQRAAMRAAVRALPLLKPGHSLRIVTLPPGLDPDDMLKRQGRGALEDLLARPQSLLEVIWGHERAAAPLDSPEAKAGLKARLQRHLDTIADPDIRALYKREWFDMFSAFAFPPRSAPAGPRPFAGEGGAPPQGVAKAGRFPRRDAPPPRPRAATAARMAAPAGAATRTGNLAAIAHGLARLPHTILPLAEDIHLLAADEPVLDALLAHAERGRAAQTHRGRPTPAESGHPARSETGGALETAPLAAILASWRIAPVETLRRQGMTFGFLDPACDERAAEAELAEVIAVLAGRRRLAEATSAAMARYESEQSAGAEAEYRRCQDALQDLRKRELEIAARLGHMTPAPGQDQAMPGVGDT